MGLSLERSSSSQKWHGTTIIGVRKNGQVTIAGDGQVSLGQSIIKSTAKKIRRIVIDKNEVIAGFAGSTADAFTLFERFEDKLQKHQGNLVRSAVELSKDWRTDRMLRRLEALLAVADSTTSLIITGSGDVIEPEHGIMAIGSGGTYAKAAALALLKETELDAKVIVERALSIAADICIYTNSEFTIEELKG